MYMVTQSDPLETKALELTDSPIWLPIPTVMHQWLYVIGRVKENTRNNPPCSVIPPSRHHLYIIHLGYWDDC